MPRHSFLWILKNIWAIKRLILVLVAFLAPIGLLGDTCESKCAYAVVVMAILWLTETFPIPVTALIPIFLLPMLGVIPAKTISTKYVNDTTMLFLGGLIVAVAVEEVNLHTRIAMGIILVLGSQPNLLMLGLMLPTWFLSMWISNTAATSMMIPIITAVTNQIRDMENLAPVTKEGEDNPGFESKEEETAITSNGEANKEDQVDAKENTGDVNDSKETPAVSTSDVEIVDVETANIDDKERRRKEAELKRLSKGFALCVAYGANIGGIATLTGTPPNIILQGIANDKFQAYDETADSGITFAKWMGFGVPLSIIVLVLSWAWLQIYFLRCSCLKKADPTKKKAIKIAVKKEFKKLGPITFGEIVVLIIFVCLALLWIFRDIPGFGGWKNLFRENAKGPFVRDSTPSILMSVLLFLLPKQKPNIFCWNKSSEDGSESKPKYTPILDWKKTAYKVPWGVLLLLGGGFALAYASEESKLSKSIGCNLRVFESFEPWVMNLIICLIVAAATEITSNSATSTLLMPIMFELALTVGLHPLYLMMSSAVACSFAFMLPVATPPNAIVFSTGYVKIPDMALAGIMMNVIAVLSLTLAINTWGKALFDLDTIPAFLKAGDVNTTCSFNRTMCTWSV